MCLEFVFASSSGFSVGMKSEDGDWSRPSSLTPVKFLGGSPEAASSCWWRSIWQETLGSPQACSGYAWSSLSKTFAVIPWLKWHKMLVPAFHTPASGYFPEVLEVIPSSLGLFRVSIIFREEHMSGIFAWLWNFISISLHLQLQHEWKTEPCWCPRPRLSRCFSCCFPEGSGAPEKISSARALWGHLFFFFRFFVCAW